MPKNVRLLFDILETGRFSGGLFKSPRRTGSDIRIAKVIGLEPLQIESAEHRPRRASPQRLVLVSGTLTCPSGTLLDRPSLKADLEHGAQAASRAAKPPNEMRAPLMPTSTVLE